MAEVSLDQWTRRAIESIGGGFKSAGVNIHNGIVSSMNGFIKAYDRRTEQTKRIADALEVMAAPKMRMPAMSEKDEAELKEKFKDPNQRGKMVVLPSEEEDDGHTEDGK